MIDASFKEKVLSRFKCQNSGNCCRIPGLVYVNQKEIQTLAAKMEMDAATFRAHYVRRVNGWEVIASEGHRPLCFLDGCNKCSVYSARPLQCRTYPDWPEIWHSEESLAREVQMCPGLKQAYTATLAEEE